MSNNRFYLANGFSLNMLKGESGIISWRKLTPGQASEIVKASGAVSVVGHPDTAAILSAMLGVEVKVNRTTISLEPGDQLVVGQYRGPRLPEGARTLPEGAVIEFFLVSLL